MDSYEYRTNQYFASWRIPCYESMMSQWVIAGKIYIFLVHSQKVVQITIKLGLLNTQ